MAVAGSRPRGGVFSLGPLSPRMTLEREQVVPNIDSGAEGKSKVWIGCLWACGFLGGPGEESGELLLLD